MPINASPEFISAEKKYLAAQTPEQQIAALEEMIRTAPAHKGGESLRANLKTRLKKFLEKRERNKKVGKSSIKGIKKEGFQCVLIGLTNSGKSALLAKLTNAKPRVESYPFTTKFPEVGTMDYQGVKAQIVDIPSIGSENFDVGTANTADCLIIVVENLEDIEKIKPYLSRAYGKQVIALNKADMLSHEQIRKIQEKIKSKKLNAILISSITGYGTDELKEKIFRSMSVIRVYTKEPGKSPSHLPVVLPIGSTIKDVAESILKGLSKRIKESRLTGPSSKFSNQKVGLEHILKDRDIVEFHTI